MSLHKKASCSYKRFSLPSIYLLYFFTYNSFLACYSFRPESLGRWRFQRIGKNVSAPLLSQCTKRISGASKKLEDPWYRKVYGQSPWWGLEVNPRKLQLSKVFWSLKISFWTAVCTRNSGPQNKLVATLKVPKKIFNRSNNSVILKTD